MAVQNAQTFELKEDHELRFEVDSTNKKSKVTLELTRGMAEVFGTELVLNKKYTMSAGAKVAVFTLHGCTINLEGPTEVAYVATETPMMMYLNTHAALEKLRRCADENRTRGPVTLVVGPSDVGKSTLCHLLLNYAVRVGRRPIFVDLDVGQGSISIPGTIGAMLVERPAAVEESFSDQAPLVYHFGHKSPRANSALYNMLVSRISESISERRRSNRKADISGVVINSCGWVKDEGYSQIKHVAQAFEVDIIIVLDQERLYNELVRDMPKVVRVVWMPKSGGVVVRSRNARIEARENRIRQYFYGPNNTLFPHSFDVKFSELKIYKVGAPALPASCMPIGMMVEDSKTKLVAVIPTTRELQNHILAVSFAQSLEEDVMQTNVAGFVCVTNVDMESKKLTVLSPQPRPLPNTILLLSELQFVEQ